MLKAFSGFLTLNVSKNLNLSVRHLQTSRTDASHMQTTTRLSVSVEGTLLLMLQTSGLLGLRSGVFGFFGSAFNPREPFWGLTM